MGPRSFSRTVRRVAAAAAAALSAVVVTSPPAGAAAQELIYSGQDYGYAGGDLRLDHSGCDKEDHTACNNLSWSISGDSITYFAVVVCRDAFDGPCRVGGLSGRNPYA